MQHPSLSKAYLEGWSDIIASVHFKSYMHKKIAQTHKHTLKPPKPNQTQDLNLHILPQSPLKRTRDNTNMFLHLF